MKGIVVKLQIAIALLLVATVITYLIYSQGGFSPFAEPGPFCGTVNPPMDTSTSYYEAQHLYAANCASCHAVHKDLTGPALANIKQRFPLEMMELFIQQPRKAFKKSKYLRDLKKEYNQIEHPAFANLSSKQIFLIMKYIEYVQKPTP
jgi:hypothetical protein